VVTVWGRIARQGKNEERVDKKRQKRVVGRENNVL
jgi:hypothetical protein